VTQTTSLTPAERVKHGLKWTIAHALYWTGVLHAWKRIALRRRAVVLVYHRVLPDDAAASTWSHPAIVVTRRTFERQMRVLRRQFTLLSVAELASRIRERRPFETASCLVTFDDGWSDVYTEAWPVLRQERIPAVVFLPVRLIGSSNVFWQERLGDLLNQTLERSGQDAAFKARALGVLAPFNLEAVLALPPGSRRSLMDSVRVDKHGTSVHAEVVIAALERLLGASAETDGHGFMSWDQVRAMAEAGVDFGGHSATHRILTTLSAGELEREVCETRAVLDRELPSPASTFSYPNGDWNEQVAAAVARHRFDVAFSMRRGAVASGDRPLGLRRINIFEDTSNSTPLFLARVLGIF
jgi:peptidoglycan/xylan/chitin deacetylase (PgdA/CDA1 family)